MRKLSLLASLLCWPATALAADLDVGPGQAFATISAAIDEAAPGDVVLVHAGEYTEDLDITSSGTEFEPIVLTAAGDGLVTVRGLVLIEGSDWRIRELTFVAPAGGDAFRIGGDRNHLEGIDLSGGDRDGVDGSGSGNQIIGSRIHDFDAGDSDAHCIVLNPGATSWFISGNELFDCSGDGIQLYADGPERTILGTEISDNRIYWSGAIARMENAIDVKNADGLLIYRNEAWGFTDNKTIVFQKAPTNVTVQCNVLHDGFTGVEFRGEDGGTIDTITFERNLMYGFSEYALKHDGVVGAVVRSNTFVDIGSDGLRIEGAGLIGGELRNNLWVRTGAIDGGDFTADHNGFFQTGSIGIASPTDVGADPLLDSAFQLGAGSPMIDAGVDVGGAFAGAAPDLGFAEVGLEGCGEPGGGEGGSGGGSPSSGPGGTGGQSGDGGNGPGAGGAPSGSNGATGANGANGATSTSGGVDAMVSGAGGGDDAAGGASDDGCGCFVVNEPRRRTWAPWAGLVAALVFAARRRRCGSA